MPNEAVTPRVTYRLQLGPNFGFAEVEALAGYFAALGVSHVYLSPILEAAPGSTHGYDVIDHHQISTVLGGPEAHTRMTAALQKLGLGVVLDIVPNHMSIATHLNTWWWDVLENGPRSRYAAYFDVDWSGTDARRQDKVLLPILGDHYAKVIEDGAIQLRREVNAFRIHVYDRVLPVAADSLSTLFRSAALAIEHETLAFAADVLESLPRSMLTDQEALVRRHRHQSQVSEILRQLVEREPAAASALDRAIDAVNGDPDALDALLEHQNYRLAYWRMARHDLDYRRFFDIDSLAALKMDDPRVFQETHDLIFEWLDRGAIEGLRIDHPDGLRDPENYFRRLRERAPNAYLVAEKILEFDEELSDRWPIDGTTGYDFLAALNGLFVAPSGEVALTRFASEFTGQTRDFHALVLEKKRLVLEELLASDLHRLSATFQNVCEGRRRYRDFTRQELVSALKEVLVHFPVYRSYVRRGEMASARDQRNIEVAIAGAQQSAPEIDRELFSLLSDLLTGRIIDDAQAELVLAFQQLSGPVTAKGVEDTAFYNHHRLVSLNEVGADPGRFSVHADVFHWRAERTQQHRPATMNALSTHDTKRSEDVRVRIAQLSEVPDRWIEAVHAFDRFAERHRSKAGPDRGSEYLFYQTLVGAWPIEADRMLRYFEKATREAKAHTSWTRPNEPYESAVQRFIEGMLGDQEFIAAFEAFLEPLRFPGQIQALSQKLIQLTAPGVPDIYQGTELWDLSLTDPDNRRAVDFAARERALARLESLEPAQIMAELDSGLPKLWVTRQALAERKADPEAFGRLGSYTALRAEGAHAERVVAFTRCDRVTTVAPRWLVGLARPEQKLDFGDTTLHLKHPARDVMSGRSHPSGEVSVTELLSAFPVALLVREPKRSAL